MVGTDSGLSGGVRSYTFNSTIAPSGLGLSSACMLLIKSAVYDFDDERASSPRSLWTDEMEAVAPVPLRVKTVSKAFLNLTPICFGS